MDCKESQSARLLTFASGVSAKTAATHSEQCSFEFLETARIRFRRLDVEQKQHAVFRFDKNINLRGFDLYHFSGAGNSSNAFDFARFIGRSLRGGQIGHYRSESPETRPR